MGISSLIKGFAAKRKQFKEMEQEEKYHRILEQKQKSSNERELERFLEEERQKAITNHLKKFRKQRALENKKMTVLQGKNIFKNHKSILSQDRNVLEDNPNLFNMRNMFFNG